MGLGSMVFNATFNNISVISWRSVFCMEETGVPGENHTVMNWPNFYDKQFKIIKLQLAL